MQVVMDIECYKDYFLVMFRAPDGRVKGYEMFDGHPLDTAAVERILCDDRVELVTFNGNKYDIPVLSLALSGACNERLKCASDEIITQNLQPWDFYEKYCSTTIDINHVDLIEVAPGIVGLKLYGGRLHSKLLQDLPIEPDASISESDRPLLRQYCANDLAVTAELAAALKSQIDLRRVMSADLGTDVRSKSDAQIAEVVLKKAYRDARGYNPKRKTIGYSSFKYTAPAYVGFGTPALTQVLQTLQSVDYVIKPSGHVEMPEVVSNMNIIISGTTYKLGLGGLHSQESEVSHYASETVRLKDIDVVSYYPTMILNMGMYPEALGPDFLDAYQEILTQRVIAKRAKDKVKDAVLKVTLNGTFGKTSNIYSVLYNPSLLIHTTLTGQLSILMLIEALEKYGIPVVSANTDGIVVKYDVAREDVLRKVVKAWENAVSLETDETDYRSIHSRDVNSYVAIKTDGSVKTKGAFASAGLAKNPQNEICNDALVAYLVNGTPVADTIHQCEDIRKFVSVRRVTGGAVKGDTYLGKVVRWYYSSTETGTINVKTNGNTVARTEGAQPCMVLPDYVPTDLDRAWYIKEATGLLMDVGVIPRPPVVKLPRKNSKAWKQLVADGVITV